MATFVNQSFGGGCTPTNLAASVSNSAMSCTMASVADWYEVGADGSVTTNPLGTSGHFALKLDYGLSTEETVICSAVNLSTGVVTIVKRGADGTTAQAHPAGSAAVKNAFPTQTAVDWVNAQAGISEAVTNASSALSVANSAQSTANLAETHAQTGIANAATAQATANSKVASVTAGDSTVTIGGTATAPTVKVTANTFDPYGAADAKLPLAGGTLTGALNGTSATFTGEVKGSDFAPTGLTGATAASRYVGGTVSGAPTSGTFALGDWIVDQSATIWVCTAAGTPGTWSPTESQSVVSTGASLTAKLGQIVIVTGASSGITITLPAAPTEGSTFGVVNNNSNTISLKGGSWPLLITGHNYGAGISYSVAANGAYLFVFDNVANRWICTTNNDIGDMVNYGDVSLDKFGAPASDLPMGSHKITGLANGTVSTDAATFGQVSAKVASVTAGDSSITVGGTATAPTVAVAQANLVVAESQVTGLVTDLADKAVKTMTISTTAPLAGGGDLSANRTLTIADASTTVKGAVQLTDSTASTSITTAATPNSVKGAYDLATTANSAAASAQTTANAALPKAGGTMSGAIAMGSNRITGLSNNALTDAALVNQLPGLTGVPFTSFQAWTAHPDTCGLSTTWAQGFVYFFSFYVPYSMTVSSISLYVLTAGATVANGYVGIYNSTTLLGQSAAVAAQWQTTGNKTHALTATSSGSLNLTQGIYWVGILVGSAVTNPAFASTGAGQSQAYNMGQNNSANTLGSRCVVTVSGGLTALPTAPLGSLTFSSKSLWAGIS